MGITEQVMPTDHVGPTLPTWTAYVATKRIGAGVKYRQRRFQVEARDAAHAVELARVQAVSDGYELFSPNAPSTLEFANQHGLTREYPISLDFHEWETQLGLDLDCSPDTGYCRSASAAMSAQRKHGRKFKMYSDWEKDIAAPALLAHGYTELWPWVDGEADSFGPLSRQCKMQKAGLFYEFWYG